MMPPICLTYFFFCHPKETDYFSPQMKSTLPQKSWFYGARFSTLFFTVFLTFQTPPIIALAPQQHYWTSEVSYLLIYSYPAQIEGEDEIIYNQSGSKTLTPCTSISNYSFFVTNSVNREIVEPDLNSDSQLNCRPESKFRLSSIASCFFFPWFFCGQGITRSFWAYPDHSHIMQITRHFYYRCVYISCKLNCSSYLWNF